MAEPIRALDEDPTPSTERPVLAAVADLGEAVGPSLGRWAAVGAVVGFLAAAVAVAAVAAAQGVDLAPAIGLGAAVGVFAGAGFGCMVGSVLVLARREAEEVRRQAQAP